MKKETQLSFEGAVLFSKEGGELTGFNIDAYTGAPVERFWGKLIVAIDGMSARQQMPVFRGHDHNEIVGYSNGFSKDSSFRVNGVFSKSTDAAKEVMALATEGFPWQASIGVQPKTTVEIKEGSSMAVNGREIFGPAEVWLESEVFEVSFVPLGADGNTSVSVFSDSRDRIPQAPALDPKAEWSQMSMADRDEFAGDFEIYAAYRKAVKDGRVRESDRATPGKGSAALSADDLKRGWNVDESLRVEFRGNFDAYLAYHKALEGGKVHVIGGTANV